ncbi:hypothetical protein [Pseudomonas sp. PDM13]|uniref:hypothetical protein n=1 Tax=Pseudomonas sp. PDM13 TaxID=2769255 RepID=UPI0021E0E89E|nr:hypothetical protein [Pseudomonas sp. PDM13]MCU9947106.1 hypothetical protein [Pseudomonas sp. PDM13]
MSSIVHGHIHCFDSSPEAAQHNRDVLARLPEIGAYLIRPMFSLLTNSRGHCHYGHLIHFAAYYKGFWDFDGAWLQEYENLLEQLFWDSSDVNHQYTGYQRTWCSAGTRSASGIGGLPILERVVEEG